MPACRLDMARARRPCALKAHIDGRYLTAAIEGRY
jgi:hypothetical protein